MPTAKGHQDKDDSALDEKTAEELKEACKRIEELSAPIKEHDALEKA